MVKYGYVDELCIRERDSLYNRKRRTGSCMFDRERVCIIEREELVRVCLTERERNVSRTRTRQCKRKRER